MSDISYLRQQVQIREANLRKEKQSYAKDPNSTTKYNLSLAQSAYDKAVADLERAGASASSSKPTKGKTSSSKKKSSGSKGGVARLVSLFEYSPEEIEQRERLERESREAEAERERERIQAQRDHDNEVMRILGLKIPDGKGELLYFLNMSIEKADRPNNDFHNEWFVKCNEAFKKIADRYGDDADTISQAVSAMAKYSAFLLPASAQAKLNIPANVENEYRTEYEKYEGMFKGKKRAARKFTLISLAAVILLFLISSSDIFYGLPFSLASRLSSFLHLGIIASVICLFIGIFRMMKNTK